MPSPDVTAVYAWLSRNADGQEGIICVPGRFGDPLPLMHTNLESARSGEAGARLAASARGFPAHLVRFDRVHPPIEEVQPPDADQ